MIIQSKVSQKDRLHFTSSSRHQKFHFDYFVKLAKHYSISSPSNINFHVNKKRSQMKTDFEKFQSPIHSYNYFGMINEKKKFRKIRKISLLAI